MEEFYRDPSRVNLSLLTDASSHYDFFFSVGFNTTKPQTWTPLELAAEILPALFEKDKLFERPGIYYGFMKFDGCTLDISKQIWASNFFDGLQYCTVTVNSNIQGVDAQEYRLLKGTTITIPGCIYERTGFKGWSVGGTDIPVGSSYVVGSDVTFDAQWGEEKRYTVTFNGNGGTPETPSLTTEVNGRL